MIVQNIKEIFVQNHFGQLCHQRHHSNKVCMICNKEPNCLEKNWLSKEQHHALQYGAQSKFFKHNQEYLRLIRNL